MTISREYGDERLSSTGISGDYPLTSPDTSPTRQRAATAALESAMLETVTDRIINGTATPQEHAEFMARFAGGIRE